jgi:hypothetical protein
MEDQAHEVTCSPEEARAAAFARRAPYVLLFAIILFLASGLFVPVIATVQRNLTWVLILCLTVYFARAISHYLSYGQDHRVQHAFVFVFANSFAYPATSGFINALIYILQFDCILISVVSIVAFALAKRHLNKLRRTTQSTH